MTTLESIKLASALPGDDFLIMAKNGERIKSPDWDKFETLHKEKLVDMSNNLLGWDNAFELVLKLGINLKKEGFVKRPYVAIWWVFIDVSAILLTLVSLSGILLLLFVK
jgi:hypothetical protein